MNTLTWTRIDREQIPNITPKPETKTFDGVPIKTLNFASQPANYGWVGNPGFADNDHTINVLNMLDIQLFHSKFWEVRAYCRHLYNILRDKSHTAFPSYYHASTLVYEM